jgi:hypothetical protein
VHAQLKQASKKQETSQNYKQPANSRQKLSPRIPSHNQYTPPMQNDDDLLFSHGFERDGSHSPPLFAYQSYPAPEDSLYTPYPQSQPYRTQIHTTETYGDYLVPAPMTLPSMMQFNEAIKREPMTDDSMNPFSMSYAAMAGLDIQGAHGYEDSNPHVSQPLRQQYYNGTRR